MKEIFWSSIENARELGSFIFVCLALIVWVGVKACFSICHDAICTFFLTVFRFPRFDGQKDWSRLARWHAVVLESEANRDAPSPNKPGLRRSCVSGYPLR